MGKKDCHRSRRLFEELALLPPRAGWDSGRAWNEDWAFPMAFGMWLFRGERPGPAPVLFNRHTLLQLFWMLKYYIDSKKHIFFFTF